MKDRHELDTKGLIAIGRSFSSLVRYMDPSHSTRDQGAIKALGSIAIVWNYVADKTITGGYYSSTSSFLHDCVDIWRMLREIIPWTMKKTIRL